MKPESTLTGFFFSIDFANCQKVRTTQTEYGHHSVPFEVPAHFWTAEACIINRMTGNIVKKFLLKSSVIGQYENEAKDLEDYIFGSDSLNGKPFTLKDSTCEKAVIDYLAKIMLDWLKENKKSIIPKIRIPQISLSHLQKVGLAPQSKK